MGDRLKPILFFNGKHLSLVHTYIRMFKVLLIFALIFVPPPTAGNNTDAEFVPARFLPQQQQAGPPARFQQWGGPPARFLPQQQQQRFQQQQQQRFQQQQQLRFQQQQQRFQQQQQQRFQQQQWGGPPARFLPQQQQRFQQQQWGGPFRSLQTNETNVQERIKGQQGRSSQRCVFCFAGGLA